MVDIRRMLFFSIVPRNDQSAQRIYDREVFKLISNGRDTKEER